MSPVPKHPNYSGACPLCHGKLADWKEIKASGAPSSYYSLKCKACGWVGTHEPGGWASGKPRLPETTPPAPAPASPEVLVALIQIAATLEHAPDKSVSSAAKAFLVSMFQQYTRGPTP